jgi:sugar O-acyltransferase (sialic acid O-acetyltransferase NeuD family)
MSGMNVGAELTPLIIYGAGGFGREAAWLALQIREAGGPYVPVCFADDLETLQGTELNDLPVYSLEEASTRFPGAAVVATAGKPLAREEAFARCVSARLQPATLIHPRAEVARTATIGEGSVICAGCVISTGVALGRGIQLNWHTTVGHDASLGDFSTTAPGVRVSGWVHAGKRVYFGANAVVLQGTWNNPLTIGDDAVIGASTCVLRAAASGVTLFGVPARPFVSPTGASE